MLFLFLAKFTQLAQRSDDKTNKGLESLFFLSGIGNDCHLNSKDDPTKRGDLMGDVLAKRTVDEVAAWYLRLSEFIDSKTPDNVSSIASVLLWAYLKGEGKKTILGRNYMAQILSAPLVKDYLETKVRPVFLTEEEAELSGGDKWAGIIPRILKLAPYAKEPGVASGGPYKIFYEGPSVSIPLNVQYTLGKAELSGRTLTRDEAVAADLLYGLHNFGLETTVLMEAKKKSGNIYTVTFKSWHTTLKDYYDFSAVKGITVPNPDFGSTSSDAVAPGEKRVKVYHRNAIRLEKAGLAQPFQVTSDPLKVTDPKITKAADVDVSRCKLEKSFWSSKKTVECS